ncbi:MAG: HNH endonuclease [Myxococcota bacterium]
MRHGEGSKARYSFHMPRSHAMLLSIARTDATFLKVVSRGEVMLCGKCLHCRRKLHLRMSGEPISQATIEHIVPRHHGGTDELRNLGIACARCNHGKGARHDRRALDDPKLAAIIAHLQSERSERWRDAESVAW